MKAIETQWKGYRFRSRLEARWALFFERLGFRWEYEPEGFETEDGERYLPDFRVWTRTSQYWVEVKGDPDWLYDSREKLERMHDFGGILPNFCCSGEKEDLSGGLLLLGNIPEPISGVYFFPFLAHDEGVHLYWRCITYANNNTEFIPDLGLAFELFTGNKRTVSCIASADRNDLDFSVKSFRAPRGWPFVMDVIAGVRAARFEHGEAPA